MAINPAALGAAALQPAAAVSLLQGLTLELDAEVLAELEQILTEKSDELETADYQRLDVSTAVFGGSAKAGQLAWHHRRAHEVLSETLLSMVTDLRDFAVGVRSAAEGVDAADQGAAADLQRKADQVHRHDQAAYDQARNDQPVAPPPEVTEPDPEATAEGGQP